MSTYAYVQCRNPETGKQERHNIMITKGGKLTTQCSENRCHSLLEDWRGALETRRVHLEGSRYDPERIVNNLPRNIRPFFLEAIEKARERHAYKRETQIRNAVLSSRSREVSDLNVVLPVGCLFDKQGKRHFSDPGNCNLNEWRAFMRDHYETYDFCSGLGGDWGEYFASNEKRTDQSRKYLYWRKYPALRIQWRKAAKLEELFGRDIPQEHIDEICDYLKQSSLIIGDMWTLRQTDLLVEVTGRESSGWPHKPQHPRKAMVRFTLADCRDVGEGVSPDTIRMSICDKVEESAYRDFGAYRDFDLR